MVPPTDPTHFLEHYQSKAPWDIGRPQPAIVRVADKVVGSVLDAGCGTGENALYFARRGHEVTGIDFVEWAISQAISKSQARRIPATFLVMDVFDVRKLGRTFDTVIDCGLFHGLSDEQRAEYVRLLQDIVPRSGRVILLCFSDREPPGEGPRRISQAELFHAFREGWLIESLEEDRFCIRDDLESHPFTPGGPRAWLCIARRV